MAANVLVICSDQHRRDGAGCYGHALVRTPHLDRLAAAGTRFTRAYAADPCCVPTRASMQTGRWVHQLATWSSGEPYDGSVPGWGHILCRAGREAVSIGKLHFRSSADDNGFARELLPMHVVGGTGFVSSMVRDRRVPYPENREFAEAIGRGESSYTRYDRRVRRMACAWLTETAPKLEKPWTLFCSFVAPHYPLIAPAAFYDLYPHDAVAMPRLRGAHERPRHPVLDVWQRVWDYDRHFRDEAHIRHAVAAYWGLISFLDDNIGRVLAALERSGQADDTLVIYTSDHGEMLGDHGLWTKMNMYEESVAVPLIAAGPGMAAGAVCDAPASHVDLQPTILAAHGLDAPPEGEALPGIALQTLAQGGARGDYGERAVLSEFHEAGAIAGMFMLRWRHWKYIAYPGWPPQLFDLAADPGEARDLAPDPAHGEALAACDARLRQMLDPEAVNARAFADQAARIAALGGREAALNAVDLSYRPAPG